MEIGHLNLRAAADKGVEFDLRHPITGKVIEDEGKPLTMGVMPAGSSKWESSAKEIRAELALDGDAEQTPEDRAKLFVETLARCTYKLPALEIGGKKVKDALTLYNTDGFGWLFKQAMDAAMDKNRLSLAKND